jgi:5'-methylthioadenosine phosphorylase
MKLGIIGGSGLYEFASNLQETREIEVDTPFGSPSDKFISGILNDIEVAFLPRHGVGHRILPGELNHKANIYAMKKLGVTHIVSMSAVGSLREELKPRDVVIVDQFFDRTKRGQDHTFFGNGIAGHISFGEPVCFELSEIAYNSAVVVEKEIKTGITIHQGGTYINMEGPAFSTKAESNTYRMWGMDVIGMTNLAEAKLAREAGICYASVAMVTDYDCWHEEHDSVTVEMIIAHLTANAEMARKIIVEVASRLDGIQGDCACSSAMDYAVITRKDLIPDQIKKDLALIIPSLVD